MNKTEFSEDSGLKGDGALTRVQILVDKSSLEVFFNDGEKVLTTYIYPDEDGNILSVFAKGGGITIKSLKIWDLSSIKMID